MMLYMDRTKIIFVCLGNICRSPAAEAVMCSLVDKEGVADHFIIDSAGTYGGHAGSRADARMIRHAQKRGINITSISRQVNFSDFEDFDRIVAMDDNNFEDLWRMAPNKEQRRKIVRMTDFGTVGNYKYVPDPYYGGDVGFELVLDILEVACRGLLTSLMHDAK
jgi:protein-tyrosine phosphatase